MDRKLMIVLGCVALALALVVIDQSANQMPVRSGERDQTMQLRRAEAIRAAERANEARNRQMMETSRRADLRVRRVTRPRVVSRTGEVYGVTVQEMPSRPEQVYPRSVPLVGGSLSAVLESTHDDRAGVWHNFGPGPGNANKTYQDWNWTARLLLPSTRTVKSMTMKHLNGYEAWSTSLSPVYGKESYPLVVFVNGRQLNTRYEQTMGPFYPGETMFQLYGQMETSRFSGATLEIAFTDGSFVSTRVEPGAPEPAAMPDNVDTMPRQAMPPDAGGGNSEPYETSPLAP